MELIIINVIIIRVRIKIVNRGVEKLRYGVNKWREFDFRRVIKKWGLLKPIHFDHLNSLWFSYEV